VGCGVGASTLGDSGGGGARCRPSASDASESSVSIHSNPSDVEAAELDRLLTEQRDYDRAELRAEQERRTRKFVEGMWQGLE
jgi:hypothetical protein